MHDNILKLRNTMRIIAVAAAVVLATGAGSALAHIEVEGHNSITGSNSLNENTVDVEDDVDVDIENNADVDNDVDLDVTTGDNDVEDNTIVEGFATGDIEADIVFDSWLNTGDDNDLESLAVSPLHVDAVFGNDRTGSNSENTNDVDIDRDVDVDITNDADIDNDFDFDLNTGDNDIEDNTIVGDVRTGDVELGVEVNSVANQSTSLDLSTLTESHASLDFSNEITGSNSENTNTVDLDSEVDIDVTNDADIDNDFDVDANTGGNDIEDNTEVGDVETGSVRINIQSTNRAN